jgi:hypothetical protein
MGDPFNINLWTWCVYSSDEVVRNILAEYLNIYSIVRVRNPDDPPIISDIPVPKPGEDKKALWGSIEPKLDPNWKPGLYRVRISQQAKGQERKVTSKKKQKSKKANEVPMMEETKRVIEEKKSKSLTEVTVINYYYEGEQLKLDWGPKRPYLAELIIEKHPFHLQAFANVLKENGKRTCRQYFGCAVGETDFHVIGSCIPKVLWRASSPTEDPNLFKRHALAYMLCGDTIRRVFKPVPLTKHDSFDDAVPHILRRFLPDHLLVALGIEPNEIGICRIPIHKPRGRTKTVSVTGRRGRGGRGGTRGKGGTKGKRKRKKDGDDDDSFDDQPDTDEDEPEPDLDSSASEHDDDDIEMTDVSIIPAVPALPILAPPPALAATVPGIPFEQISNQKFICQLAKKGLCCATKKDPVPLNYLWRDYNPPHFCTAWPSGVHIECMENYVSMCLQQELSITIWHPQKLAHINLPCNIPCPCSFGAETKIMCATKVTPMMFEDRCHDKTIPILLRILQNYQHGYESRVSLYDFSKEFERFISLHCQVCDSWNILGTLENPTQVMNGVSSSFICNFCRTNVCICCGKPVASILPSERPMHGLPIWRLYTTLPKLGNLGNRLDHILSLECPYCYAPLRPGKNGELFVSCHGCKKWSCLGCGKLSPIGYEVSSTNYQEMKTKTDKSVIDAKLRSWMYNLQYALQLSMQVYDEKTGQLCLPNSSDIDKIGHLHAQAYYFQRNVPQMACPKTVFEYGPEWKQLNVDQARTALGKRRAYQFMQICVMQMKQSGQLHRLRTLFEKSAVTLNYTQELKTLFGSLFH